MARVLVVAKGRLSLNSIFGCEENHQDFLLGISRLFSEVFLSRRHSHTDNLCWQSISVLGDFDARFANIYQFRFALWLLFRFRYSITSPTLRTVGAYQ